MGSLAKITNHIDLAKARLMSMFKGKTLLGYFIKAWGGEAQAFEDALIAVANCYKIDTAEGYNLDTLGMIIAGGKRGEARGNSVDDAEFRLRLKAFVRARLSKGRAEDVYKVFEVLMAATQTAKAHRQENASIEYEIIGTVTTAALASVMLRFLRQATAGSQRAVLSWSPVLQASTFCANESSATIRTQLVGAHAQGATTINVISTTGFAASGRATINAGLGGEMDVAYTGKTATSLTGATPLPIAAANNDYCAQSTATGQWFVPQSVTTALIALLDTTITVTTTTAFPSSGSLDVMRADGSARSTFFYTNKNATQFTGIAAIGTTFPIGAEVLGRDGGGLAASQEAT